MSRLRLTNISSYHTSPEAAPSPSHFSVGGEFCLRHILRMKLQPLRITELVIHRRVLKLRVILATPTASRLESVARREPGRGGVCADNPVVNETLVLFEILVRMAGGGRLFAPPVHPHQQDPK